MHPMIFWRCEYEDHISEELEQMVYAPRNIDISKLFSDRPLRKKTMDKYACIDETHFVFSIDKIAKF